jgi:hypothetical protein
MRTTGKSTKRREKHRQELALFMAALIVRRMERVWQKISQESSEISPKSKQETTLLISSAPHSGADDPRD